MEMTYYLKERFAKDTKIPINIFEEPYFTQRLDWLDKSFPEKQYKNQWNDFVSMLNDFNNDQDYFEYYNKVKDNAINAIKSSKGWEQFNNEDMNKFKNNIGQTHKNLSKNIYCEQNCGKEFVSIDISSANFSVLKRYDKGIFNDKETWRDFLRQFTKYEHILNSKYIRQVILGNCNPSRVITYENYIAELICQKFEAVIHSAKLICFSTDELIFEVSENKERELYPNIIEHIRETLGVNVRIEEIIFVAIRDAITKEILGYEKKSYDVVYQNSEFTYKCLDGDWYYLILKSLTNSRYGNEEITQDDLAFIYKKKVCYLKDAIKIEI